MENNLQLLTARFIEAYDYIISHGMVKNQKHLGLNDSNVNKVKKGFRTVSLNQILFLVNKYNVSAEFIFRGEKPIIREE